MTKVWQHLLRSFSELYTENINTPVNEHVSSHVDICDVDQQQVQKDFFLGQNLGILRENVGMKT